MLSALAVLRLMTSPNFAACSTGRSAGFVPFRMRSAYVAARRYSSPGRAPYDMSPPASPNPRKLPHRREAVARHRLDEPLLSHEEQRITSREQCIGAGLRYRCDHALYLVGYAHFETEELDAQRVRDRLRLTTELTGVRIR